jgi:hypothetical protein
MAAAQRTAASYWTVGHGAAGAEVGALQAVEARVAVDRAVGPLVLVRGRRPGRVRLVDDGLEDGGVPAPGVVGAAVAGEGERGVLGEVGVGARAGQIGAAGPDDLAVGRGRCRRCGG